MLLNRFSCFVFFAGLLLLAEFCAAAEIRCGVSSRETYVGKPVILQIQIVNANDHREPEIPEVDGLEITSIGPPMRREMISSSNFRSSTRKVTLVYNYEVTPQRAGTFTIPPITISADGLSEITKAIRIVAVASETGDLMFVEVTGSRDSIYVGESLDVTLKIWVRPYQERGVILSERAMWERLSTRETEWGMFSDRMTELAERRRRPGGREVLRSDGNGDERSYYLYEVEATVYPDRPGMLDASDVRIVMQYPTGLGQSPSPFDDVYDDMLQDALSDFPGGGLFDRLGSFGTSLRVTSSRPIVGQTKVNAIEVKPVPTDSRPEDYRGAVGQYQIVTSASPESAKVGDPVTLSLRIAGNGRLDLLRAPPLADQADLTKDFRVEQEELPGFVFNDTKEFQTTIRPRHDGVHQIPAIRLSYFDPKSEKFVTTSSEPIPLRVEKSETLKLDSIVTSRGDADTRPDQEERSNVAPPRLFQDSSVDLLLVNQMPAPAIPASLAIAMLLPPLICVVALVALRRKEIAAFAAKFVSSKRQFTRNVARAEDFAQLGEALQVLLARRFGSDDTANHRSWPIGQIRAAGKHDLAIRVERFYSQCDKATYTGIGNLTLEAMKAEAVALAGEVAAIRPLRVKRTKHHAAAPSASGLLALAALLTVAGGSSVAQQPTTSGLTLGDQQRRTLLKEAAQLYQDAMAKGDDSDARETFALAAEKYQWVVDSGVNNSTLYFNLAGAQLQSEQYGRAIANYRRALKLFPNSRLYRKSLAIAQQRLADARGQSSQAVGFLPSLRTAGARLSEQVSPPIVLAITCVSWGLIWIALLLRMMRIRFPWKSAVLVAMLVFSAGAASYYAPLREFTRTDAVVIVLPEVVLRAGDGQSFAEVTQLQDAEGTVVPLLDVRDRWIRVRLDDTRSGWIEGRAAEVI